MEKPNVISIGFEGSNRSGKGTQIELFSSHLEKMDIPYLVVRGDGSRPNQGKHIGDPISEWWSKILPLLKSPENKDSDLWNYSSARLARELVVFRDRVLPNIAEHNNKPVAVLLVIELYYPELWFQEVREGRISPIIYILKTQG